MRQARPLQAIAALLALLGAASLASGSLSADPAFQPLDGIWLVDAGPTDAPQGCAIDRQSYTMLMEPSNEDGAVNLWNWYRAGEFAFDGRFLTATHAAVFGDAENWGDPKPPQQVVEQLRARNLQQSLRGQLSADGRQINATDEEFCIWWRDGALTDVTLLTVPLKAAHVGVSLRAISETGVPLAAVQPGGTLRLELTTDRAITWNAFWLNLPGGDKPLWIETKPDETRQVFRSALLTVLPPAGAPADLQDEAEAGRLYAAAGDRLVFQAGKSPLARVEVAIGAGADAHLQPPTVDDLALRVAQGALDADIEDLERRIAAEQDTITRQAAAIETLAEAARTKEADIQRLEAQQAELQRARDALAIDRAALPSELQSLLRHRDNLLREKGLAEDRLLAASDRGDQIGMAAEVKLLDSLAAQLDEANRRIRDLWAAVPESNDDLRPTTPAQLQRAQQDLDRRIDALRPQILEARLRRGFDETSTQVAQEAIAAAEAAIAKLTATLDETKDRRRRIDRPFGYVQFIRATQDDLTRYEAGHEDLERLRATFEQARQDLLTAQAALFEAEQLNWRLRQAFLAAAEEVASEDRAVLGANWSSLAKQLGVEVLGTGAELGFSFLTGGPPGLLIDATSKLAFNLWDIYKGQEPIQNFDASGLAALVAKQRENEEKQYDADALLDDDSYCRYAAAAGAEAQRLSITDPELFPKGALFDRYGWPILREVLAMGVKDPATLAAQRAAVENRIERGLADLAELRRMRTDPVPWLEAMDPQWRSKVDLEAALAAERRSVTNAIDDLARLGSWRRQAAHVGLGILVSVAVNVGKQKAEEWIRSKEGEAYVAFFEKQMAMTQAWRAFMGSSCLRWKEVDHVDRLQAIYDAMLKAYDLEMGFVISTDQAIDLGRELVVDVPLSQGRVYPMDLVIAGVTGEPAGPMRWRFPAGSLAAAPRGEPLPVVLRIKAPPQ